VHVEPQSVPLSFHLIYLRFRYQALFVANAFDGALLHDASDDTLKSYVESLGISSALHRASIILLLKQVRAHGSL
jgi:hypothetical protein